MLITRLYFNKKIWVMYGYVRNNTVISTDLILRKVIICLVDQNFWDRTELEGNLEYQDAFDCV